MADTFDTIPLTVNFLGASIYLGKAAAVPHGGVTSAPAYKLGTILSGLHDALTLADAKVTEIAANPDLNDAARKRRMVTEAGKLFDAATGMRQDADRIAAEIDTAEAALFPGLPDDAPNAIRAREMRDYLRGLPGDERRDFISAQAKAGNPLPVQAAADPGPRGAVGCRPRGRRSGSAHLRAGQPARRLGARGQRARDVPVAEPGAGTDPAAGAAHGGPGRGEPRPRAVAGDEAQGARRRDQSGGQHRHPCGRVTLRSMARQLRRAAARIDPPRPPAVWVPAYRWGAAPPAPPGRSIRMGAILGPPEDPAKEDEYEELRLRDRP